MIPQNVVAICYQPMAPPVKIADSLLEAARSAAAESNRSMAAQIEHWASLGRAVELALTTGDVLALKRVEGRLDADQRARIAQALTQAFDPQRAALTRSAIGARDAVRYESDPAAALSRPHSLPLIIE